MTPPLAITVQPQKRAKEALAAAAPAPQTLPSRLGGEDIATLEVNGRLYENWTSISATSTYMALAGRTFVVSLAEPSDMASRLTWSSFRMKPGDRATLYLAGLKACDGYIVKRNVQMDGNSHSVTVEGGSLDIDLTKATAKHRQFRGYSFESIVNTMLRDAGLPTTFRLENKPPGIDEPFRNIITDRFSSVFRNIARVARMRGVFLYADVDGNLVGTVAQAATPATQADLVEGINIVAASVTLDDENVLAKIRGLAQQQGSDNLFGREASEVAAEGGNPTARPWRQRDFAIDGAADQKTAQHRTNFQLADSLYTSVDAQVVVQGWRRPNGRLWEPTTEITVQMPSYFPENGGRMQLGLRTVSFTQSGGGTTTILGMCLRQALGAPPDPGVRGEAPNLLSPSPEAAQPLTPQ